MLFLGLEAVAFSIHKFLIILMICMKCIAGPDGVKNCLGSVDRPGLYVLCHLLDVSSYIIPHSPTSITPFGKEAGITIAFKWNTFIEERTTVDFKVPHKLSLWNFEDITVIH